MSWERTAKSWLAREEWLEGHSGYRNRVGKVLYFNHKRMSILSRTRHTAGAHWACGGQAGRCEVGGV